MPKIIVGTTATCDGLTSENASFSLHFGPAKETQFKRQRFHVLPKSDDEVSSPVARQNSSCMSETWNNDQIDDFVRKLGFLEVPSLEVESSVRFFQQLNQVYNYIQFCALLLLANTYVCVST